MSSETARARSKRTKDWFNASTEKQLWSRKQLRNFPADLLYIAKGVLYHAIVYPQFNSSEFWRARAVYGPRDSRGVLYANRCFNSCFREEELRIIKELVWKYNVCKGHALDVGCGMGDVSRFLVDLGFEHVDAVDFGERIEVAQRVNPHPRIRYIPSSAESYLVGEKYDLILSSGGLAVIRNLGRMFGAIDNCIAMLGEGCHMLMIDPFHTSYFLARAKISAEEVTRHMQDRGLSLLESGGMLFWPLRLMICDSESLNERRTRILFNAGERLMRKLGRQIWGDYKILLFRKLDA